MRGLKILKYPAKALRKKAAFVEKVGDSEKKLLLEMAHIMYEQKGVGLAATQVGVSKRIAVIDVGEGLINIINPVIVKKEGSEVQEEGCLSVPEIVVKVRRAEKIAVNFLNATGEATQLKADGLLCRALQHEIDHLEGRLIIDYLYPIKKIFLKGC